MKTDNIPNQALQAADDQLNDLLRELVARLVEVHPRGRAVARLTYGELVFDGSAELHGAYFLAWVQPGSVPVPILLAPLAVRAEVAHAVSTLEHSLRRQRAVDAMQNAQDAVARLNDWLAGHPVSLLKTLP